MSYPYMHTVSKVKIMFFILFIISLLASGSDDQHAIIWDPFRHKKLTTMHTGHAANIFSVKVRSTNWKIDMVISHGKMGHIHWVNLHED